MSTFGKKRTPTHPEGQKSNTPVKWKQTMANPLPPVRCVSMTEKGKQCGQWSRPGSEKCVSHESPADAREAQQIVEAARLRLVGLVEPAIGTIEELLSPATGEATRLKAAETILDRAGLVKGSEVQVTVAEDNRSAELVAEKLKAIRTRNAADAEREREDNEVIEVTEVDDDNSK